MAGGLGSWVFTPHALAEMARRGIERSEVEAIVRQPEQRIPARPGRDVLQSRVAMAGTTYIVRIFVDIDRSPPEIVTVYRSSKIDKYWSR